MATLDDILKNLPSIKGKPMLAGRVEFLHEINFPVLASTKIDGYRAIYSDGVMFTRVGKRHPAPAVQAIAAALKERGFPNGLDGELIVPHKNFNEAGGLLRRNDYSGDVRFIIFDIMQEGMSAQNRYEFLSVLSGNLPSSCRLLKQWWIENQEDLERFEDEALSQGFEGVVTRKPSAFYKHGRGTLRDQIMLKIKRFRTAEARVISVEPRRHNENPLETNPLGYAERASNQENLVDTDILGKMNVVGINAPFEGVHFSIGNFDGLTDEIKRDLLSNPPLNSIVTFKYFPEGVKDKPRHPVFLSFRPSWDIETGEEKDA